MTSNTLDFAVAQAVLRARQIERALHDPGPWEVSFGTVRVPAHKIIHDDRVAFFAQFPSLCYIVRPDPILNILCAGEIVGTKEVEFPGEGEFEIMWEWAVETPVSA